MEYATASLKNGQTLGGFSCLNANVNGIKCGFAVSSMGDTANGDKHGPVSCMAGISALTESELPDLLQTSSVKIIEMPSSPEHKTTGMKGVTIEKSSRANTNMFVNRIVKI